MREPRTKFLQIVKPTQNRPYKQCRQTLYASSRNIYRNDRVLLIAHINSFR